MIELIPAIDLYNGRCVRLTKGDYDLRTTYDADPAAIAAEFERLGYRRLHMVDLNGAESKHIVNADVLRAVATTTNLTVDFGGGIKTDEDIETAFNCGAAMVTVGSVAVTRPDLLRSWTARYGADRIILGADVRNGMIAINGWREDSPLKLKDFIASWMEHGIRNILCTDISRDGTLKGPATDLYREVMETFPDLHLIASGGVSDIDDIKALNAAGIPAEVFGKAIYEGKINMKELWDWQNA